MSLHQLVTLASIVEKEAALADGAAHHRRRLPATASGWTCPSRPTRPSPTPWPRRDGRPRASDLQVDHPFNTYKNRGLPPGPIGNPGRAAIDAVLEPANVPYLYFVAIDDRAHHFSTTLDEHNQAVARYRQYRARSRVATLEACACQRPDAMKTRDRRAMNPNWKHAPTAWRPAVSPAAAEPDGSPPCMPALKRVLPPSCRHSSPSG